MRKADSVEKYREMKRKDAQRTRDRNRATAPPPPKIYRRECNRCKRPYRGKGRLLCDQCFEYATRNFFPAGGRY